MPRAQARHAPPDRAVNRVDLVTLEGRWVAIYTGPHAHRVMETAIDYSCMIPTPFPADRQPDEVIAWLRTTLDPTVLVTAAP